MPQNILLIQSDLSDAKAIQEALVSSHEASFQVEWVRYLTDGLERLTKEEGINNIHAVLVDLSLPDSHGVESFDQIFSVAPQIPILVLGSPQDKDIAELAVKHGAQDYLLKTHLDNYWLPKILDHIIKHAGNRRTLFEEKERALVTLDSIGDAVITTDPDGNVTDFNRVAGELIGPSLGEGIGHPLEKAFRIVDDTDQTEQSPIALALEKNKIVKLPPDSVLINREGHTFPVQDSAAPIHDREGQVIGAVMVFHDETSAKEQTSRVLRLTHYDPLTNLPNRTLFSERLSHAIDFAQPYENKKIAVLFVALDRFKHVNDSLGHAVGDGLLQSVSERLRACVRNADTVGRYGGDKFLILLADVAQPQDAVIIANKILQALATPHIIDEHKLHITGSIGTAVYPDDGTAAETLIRNADFAAYSVKAGGGNNHQFFKSDMNLRAVARQSIEDDLRQAIERQEFVLHYQPKVNVETGAITGAEALIRWNHPRRGLISPAEFIPVAEECGFIIPIGQWGLREACRQTRAWQDAGLPPLGMAFNISARELCASNFVSGVAAIVRETGLPPQWLELELTETFLMENPIAIAAILQALKNIGVSLTLDDFGTGYSSLSYLNRFPIDALKIDKSFMEDKPASARIIIAVINMAKSLGIKIIAEGVETTEQLAFLKAHQCPEVQGYYFSRPLAAKEFTELLMRSVAEKLPFRPAPNQPLENTGPLF